MINFEFKKENSVSRLFIKTAMKQRRVELECLERGGQTGKMEILLLLRFYFFSRRVNVVTDVFCYIVVQSRARLDDPCHPPFC